MITDEIRVTVIKENLVRDVKNLLGAPGASQRARKKKKQQKNPKPPRSGILPFSGLPKNQTPLLGENPLGYPTKPKKKLLRARPPLLKIDVDPLDFFLADLCACGGGIVDETKTTGFGRWGYVK